jgi:pyruvate/2-oxoglutarate dehydrogenase complex dihydrolipoamide dehydrogenase (E3) component
MTTHYDFFVIGSGSAASSAWYQARALGKSVAVVEKDVLGGECPTFACVPSKALLQAAQVYRTVLGASAFGVETGSVRFNYEAVKARKDLVVSRTGAARGEEPYREMGVEVIHGEARFVSQREVEVDGRRYTAERFLIATGSKPVIPDVEGLAGAGYLTFKDAIDLTRLPSSVCILGGGPVGCEFAEIFAGFGARVTLVDQNSLLLAKEDPEVGHFLAHSLIERGIEVMLDAGLARVDVDGRRKTVIIDADGSQRRLDVEAILVATGSSPNLDLKLEAAGIRAGRAGIEVNDHLQTTNPVVYAAGDCVGPFEYTHAASYQGRIAALNALDDRSIVPDYRGMPRCVFTMPEIATAGLTEQQARDQGLSPRAGFAQLAGLGRANTSESFDGFVKVVVDGQDVLIGAAIVAPRAGEMIHELSLAIRLGIKASTVADAIHAFPTYSEAIGQACSAIEDA